MNESSSYYRSEAERFFQEAYEKQTKGDFEGAVKLYHQSLELYPTAEAHTFLGWVYSMQGRLDEAIEECHRAIRVDPDYGNPYNDIGAYLIEKGSYDESLSWFQKAVQAKRYECYCYPHYNMGRVWEKKGDWGNALKCYQDAIIENREYKLAKQAVNRLLSLYN